ncbi:MAG: hypothetical protein C4558_02990 [Dehalococcoidia bacterium]|nr:MAG: hypothetical protein C4558_02990 [Dehalococcoidia bacterium]
MALAAIALQIALSLTAPGFAAWSPAHAHITLDGRDHAHVHVWEPTASAQNRIPGHEADNHAQSVPAPSRDLGVAGAAIALPAAVILFATAGVAVLTRLAAAPLLRAAAPVPITPPPRG